MKCPGQDTRYWGEDAAFEVPCPKCGRSVEIFKDESSARCTGCEHRFRNPKLDLKCAEWCAYAQECLGFAVPRVKSANLGEGALASRLIQAVKEEFIDDQSRITRALMAFQHAKELASAEGGDARLAMAAVLLLEVGGRDADKENGAVQMKNGVDADLTRPKKILDEVGIKDPTAAEICRILELCLHGGELDTVEARVVSDSYALTDISSHWAGTNPAEIDEFLESRLSTDAARRRGRNLLDNGRGPSK